VIASAPCEDLAVLRVTNTAGLATLPVGRKSDIEQGQDVVAVGFPGSASARSNLQSTTGVVSVVSTDFSAGFDVPVLTDVVQTDAAINPGNSGGPLLDLDGRLVGVNVSVRTQNDSGRTIQGQGYAIGADRVRSVTGELRQGRSIGWTGAGLEPVPAEELRNQGLPPGMLITGAAPGTSAADAGFNDGVQRLLVEVNGQSLDGSVPSYCRAIGNARSGDTVSYSYLQQGATGIQTARLAVR
jgi:S1-C subfamily serine protease